jgi:hypothetical protein
MYAYSRLLLQQGFPDTVTEIDTAAVHTAHQRRYRCNAGIGLILGLSLLRWLLHCCALGTWPGLGRAAAQLGDRGLLPNISAQHGRLWNRLIVKRLQKIKEGPKLLVMADAVG